MAEAQPSRPKPSKPKPKRKKLPRLPQNAKVSKRPLHRPAILSPYTSASQQKTVYIASHTPFLSAVKRVEKLLDLADKRLVQAATTNVKKPDARAGGGKRKRGAGGDEILGVAEELERLKGKKRQGLGEDMRENEEDGVGAGEEVVLKGTGKAIHRVLELALWFQQREEQYAVRLKTGSVGAIDDVAVDEDGQEEAGEKTTAGGAGHASEDAEEVVDDAMDVDEPDATDVAHHQLSEEVKAEGRKKKGKRVRHALPSDKVPETRIRYMSVLEAYVSLR